MTDKPKSPQERAKEYCDEHYSSGKPIVLSLGSFSPAMQHFLAGRADFIENDLRGLLERARVTHGQNTAFLYSIEAIIADALARGE